MFSKGISPLALLVFDQYRSTLCEAYANQIQCIWLHIFVDICRFMLIIVNVCKIMKVLLIYGTEKIC